MKKANGVGLDINRTEQNIYFIVNGYYDLKNEQRRLGRACASAAVTILSDALFNQLYAIYRLAEVPKTSFHQCVISYILGQKRNAAYKTYIVYGGYFTNLS